MVIQNIINSFTKSWRTTVLGFIAGLILVIPQLKLLFDGNAETVADFNDIAYGVLAAFGLGMSRDNSVASESAAADKIKK
tara:strand:- start:228 stop:467 length:240 start_codon:yes stop_codon:yes gene_type:complete